jgi:hypothetical protein
LRTGSYRGGPFLFGHITPAWNIAFHTCIARNVGQSRKGGICRFVFIHKSVEGRNAYAARSQEAEP